MTRDRDTDRAQKALMTASVASMLDNFNRSNIKLLLEAGYEVTLAANFDAVEDSSPLSKLTAFRKEMEALGCRVIQIDFSRKIGNLPRQLKSYRQLKALAKEDFALVHCNSPICAAMTRLAFRKKRKNGTRVIYTAHGFHFFSGAPVRNWVLYFPVEWVCAHWTDILNTINREDYKRARKWLKAKKVVYLPGVGIDLDKFRPGSADREAVRRNLGIRENEKMLLSVGELSKRKNQAAVIRALKILKDDKKRDGTGTQMSGFTDLRYVLCGQGEAEAELKALAEKLGVADQVLFLGYREDVSELCQAADLFVFPSLQEGLPMALLEAIAVKTPVICSDIRGNRELVPEKELRFEPGKPERAAECIFRALKTGPEGSTKWHLRIAERFRIQSVDKKMKEEYLL